ncbi:ASCH domain-containing protein [Paucibacter sp. JuS9]|uniref:ASCH domain-containing protein n=1 Tax=Roseateles TaxID=93681 RepID=UPI002FE5BC96
MTTAHIPSHLVDFWSAFSNSIGGIETARFYEACIFGDSEELANELAALVLRGVKRATAASVWSCEGEGKRLPVPGDLSIVTNWAGSPLCIIETEAVELVPFNEVSAEFAATEGEGDGSLSFWREAHRQYFTRECSRAGRQFSEDMLVACERFKLVYRPSISSV